MPWVVAWCFFSWQAICENKQLISPYREKITRFTLHLSPSGLLLDMAYNRGIHSSNNGGNKGRRFALMLLLAFGAALLGVTALHIHRERRFFNLLVKDRDRQLLSLRLLLQVSLTSLSLSPPTHTCCSICTTRMKQHASWYNALETPCTVALKKGGGVASGRIIYSLHS